MVGRRARVFTWNLWRPSFDIEKLAFYSLDGRAYPIIDCLKDYLRTRCFLAERLLPLRVKEIEDRLTGGRPQQHISSNSAT